MSILGSDHGSEQVSKKGKSSKRDNKPRTGEAPFHKLMSNQLRQLYEMKLLDAPAYILFIVQCNKAAGWRWTFRVKDFCKEWGISKTAFYRAVSKLRDLGLLHWEVGDTITVWHGTDIARENSPAAGFDTFRSPKNSPAVGTGIPAVGTGIPAVGTGIPAVGTAFPLAGQQTAETLVNTSVAKTPDYIQSYSDFLKTLSDSERENFEKFVREEWKSACGQDIISLERFLAKEEDLKNWQERFFKTTAGREVKKKAIATKYDWRNDPRFADWIWKAFNDGYPWTQEDEAERDERYAFWEWAQDTNAYEGVCYQ